MCLTAADVSPLCDECFSRLRELPEGQEFEMCDECKKFMVHYCEYCMTYKGDEIIEEGICRECRKELDFV